MAAIYRKKYYKNIVSCGHGWTLEIHQQSERPFVAKEIGAVLQGLRLYVQGDQADIDTPIVKTSLEMTFVDAPDLEDRKKCGNWEEFYTSDATQYKVLLYKDGILEWTGYITPDSFSEDLMYRGSVTIIARDNLGTLQDFIFNAECDENNMIQLNQLITAAKNAISFPMEIVWNYNDARRVPYSVLTKFEPFADEILFNQSALIGRNWWDILETVLYSTGFALRYVGGNTFMLSSLRDIPLYNFELWSDVPVKPVSFLSYGHRELTPAAKEIKDSVVFELSDNVSQAYIIESEYGNSALVNAAIDAEEWYNPQKRINIPVYELRNSNWSAPSLDKSLFLNPFAYKLKEGYISTRYGDLHGNNAVYLAANPISRNEETGNDMFDFRSASYRQKIGKGKYKLSFVFGTPAGLYDNMTKVGFDINQNGLGECLFNLRFIPNNANEDILEYYVPTSSNEDPTWKAGYRYDYNQFVPLDTENKFPLNYEIPEFEIPSVGTLELEIKVVSTLGQPSTFGSYVQIKDLKIEDLTATDASIQDKLNTITKYNAKNSLILTRNINFGFNMATSFGVPSYIKNGMYVLDSKDWYAPSDEWVYEPSGTPKPLSVLIHQQLLAYYAKPNNVLTGELATPNPTFNALYEWGGKKHLLMSGALNILTGRMENAILREFMRYDHMWETWAEIDIIAVDYVHWHEDVVIHTNKDLTLEDIKTTNGDGWLYVHNPVRNDDGTYRVRIYYDDNYTGKNREGFVNIDGFILRVTQSTFGDYSNDYNNDYL